MCVGHCAEAAGDAGKSWQLPEDETTELSSGENCPGEGMEGCLSRQSNNRWKCGDVRTQ